VVSFYLAEKCILYSNINIGMKALWGYPALLEKVPTWAFRLGQRDANIRLPQSHAAAKVSHML
jgi:hypothetical protein